MSVVVCVYTHRHGSDVWTFDTLSSAYEIVVTQHILPDLDKEVSDPEKRTAIRAFAEAGRFEAAVDTYNEAQSAEHTSAPEEFCFYETNIQSAPKHPVAHGCTCPKCGNDDLEEMEVLETYTAYHPIRDWDGAFVHVENALGLRSPSEQFDDGAGDYRVHCCKCMHDDTVEAFGLPGEWDWV